MATQLFSNNAVSLLAAPIAATDTMMTVMTNHGTLFPQPTNDGSDYFLITLEDQTGTYREIIRVRARYGDTFTDIQRGQEGSTQRAWSASAGSDTLVDHRITAETMRLAMQLPLPPVSPSGGIQGVTVQDEGVVLPALATTLNFVGTNVSVTGNGATKTVTIAGTGGTGPAGPTGPMGPEGPAGPAGPSGIQGVTLQEEGVALSTLATTLNFVGPNVTVTGAGATKTVTIDAYSGPSGILGIEVQDESVPIAGLATKLDFAGAGVSVVDNGNTKTIVIPGATAGIQGITVEDEGVALVNPAVGLNFTGAGVTVTGSGATKIVNIPGGGSTGTAWINGASAGPTEVDVGWTLPISSVTYSQFNRGFKFFVTIVMPANGRTMTCEVAVTVTGDISANAETADWTTYAVVGPRLLGSIGCSLNTVSNTLHLTWTNNEALTTQVMCTRIQHAL
jgi:hypothetical protein